MSKLPIDKRDEAVAIATIWNMGGESLDPVSYIQLERIMGELCETRNIDFERVGMTHKFLSQLDSHFSDCPSNNAPAMLPAPCDCAQCA